MGGWVIQLGRGERGGWNELLCVGGGGVRVKKRKRKKREGLGLPCRPRWP